MIRRNTFLGRTPSAIRGFLHPQGVQSQVGEIDCTANADDSKQGGELVEDGGKAQHRCQSQRRVGDIDSHHCEQGGESSALKGHFRDYRHGGSRTYYQRRRHNHESPETGIEHAACLCSAHGLLPDRSSEVPLISFCRETCSTLPRRGTERVAPGKRSAARG